VLKAFALPDSCLQSVRAPCWCYKAFALPVSAQSVRAPCHTFLRPTLQRRRTSRVCSVAALRRGRTSLQTRRTLALNTPRPGPPTPQRTATLLHRPLLRSLPLHLLPLHLLPLHRLRRPPLCARLSVKQPFTPRARQTQFATRSSRLLRGDELLQAVPGWSLPGAPPGMSISGSAYTLRQGPSVVQAAHVTLQDRLRERPTHTPLRREESDHFRA
jgi:hypothetical protein